MSNTASYLSTSRSGSGGAASNCERNLRRATYINGVAKIRIIHLRDWGANRNDTVGARGTWHTPQPGTPPLSPLQPPPLRALACSKGRPDREKFERRPSETSRANRKLKRRAKKKMKTRFRNRKAEILRQQHPQRPACTRWLSLSGRIGFRRWVGERACSRMIAYDCVGSHGARVRFPPTPMAIKRSQVRTQSKGRSPSARGECTGQAMGSQSHTQPVDHRRGDGER